MNSKCYLLQQKIHCLELKNKHFKRMSSAKLNTKKLNNIYLGLELIQLNKSLRWFMKCLIMLLRLVEISTPKIKILSHIKLKQKFSTP